MVHAQKVGQPINLKVQLEGGEENLFPRAYLIDIDGNTVGSPVDLTHVAHGFYQNDSVNMPDVSELHATYKIFDDSGHTTLNSDYNFGDDVFQRDDENTLLSSLSSTPDLEVEISDDDEIKTQIEEC